MEAPTTPANLNGSPGDPRRPLDDPAFKAACERVDKALVAVMSADLGREKIERLEIGTGVLVRLGGRELVFTAAHNVIIDGEPLFEQ
ncbi:MAG TPA: hypothetical protein VNZ26_09995, partial [Vicinamibacterales bacterium]|nr:hypothetical protein [Vicinamibacterales bacterium]